MLPDGWWATWPSGPAGLLVTHTEPALPAVLAAASDVPTTSYTTWGQWGTLGLTVVALAGFARGAYADVKGQRDAERTENGRLNEAIREKYVPALRDSDNALRQALLLVSGVSEDNTRLADTLARTAALLDEARGVIARNAEVMAAEVVPALRAATEMAMRANRSAEETRREHELRARIRAEMEAERRKGTGGDVVAAAE